jgi:hypothetical protein
VAEPKLPPVAVRLVSSALAQVNVSPSASAGWDTRLKPRAKTTAKSDRREVFFQM